MVRDICKDKKILARRSTQALAEDMDTARDLMDTLVAHRDGCVGMAANMIGVNKRIIAVQSEQGYMLMLNPVILEKYEPYEAEESCLSLDGVRKTTRYMRIKLRWQTETLRERTRVFEGLDAQIIQHELDHCNGILI